MAKAVKGVVSVFGETDLALTFQDVILSNWRCCARIAAI